MVRVHTQKVGDSRVLVDRQELQKLVEVARHVEDVEVIEMKDDLPVEGLMRLAEQGGSFEFLTDPREDVYALDDLKVRYR